MRHRRNINKLGRSSAHRKATVASLVCALIEDTRIRTTIAKAKQARSLAEKMITLARKQTLAARRQAIARLRRPQTVKRLFDDVAPQFEGRAGGYTRIIKMGSRSSDGSEMAILEWVDIAAPSRKRKAKASETDKKAAAAKS